MTEPDYSVAIIGAGPSGIAMGVKLLQAGIEDFTILERGDGVGGSWRDNRYPGICADSPGLAYQYSFDKNRSWSRFFPVGAEVLEYHQRIARNHGLQERLQTNTEVVGQQWDDVDSVWRLRTADGRTIVTRFLVTAVGVFRDAVIDPGIAGLGEFAGVVQRTASWDPEVNPAGLRVAVIGTGASAVQVVPHLAKTAAIVDVYQRTPVWCLPKPDFALGGWFGRLLSIAPVMGFLHGIGLWFFDLMLRLAARLPGWLARRSLTLFDQGARALYRRRLRRTVRDPALVELLAPRFGLVVKRPVLSNDFLKTFDRPGTNLVTEPITRITKDGIQTASGVRRSYDIVVLATGFTPFTDPAATPPGSVRGRGGSDLGLLWQQDGMQAYEGMSVPAFPNRWMMVGPYSWTGTGWHSAAESTAEHIARLIGETQRRGVRSVEVKPSAHRRYMDGVRRNGSIIRWYYTELNAGVRSYYVNAHGDVPYIRPGSYRSAVRAGRRPSFDDYEFVGRGDRPSTARRGLSAVDGGANGSVNGAWHEDVGKPA